MRVRCSHGLSFDGECAPRRRPCQPLCRRCDSARAGFEHSPARELNPATRSERESAECQEPCARARARIIAPLTPIRFGRTSQRKPDKQHHESTSCHAVPPTEIWPQLACTSTRCTWPSIRAQRASASECECERVRSCPHRCHCARGIFLPIKKQMVERHPGRRHPIWMAADKASLKSCRSCISSKSRPRQSSASPPRPWQRSPSVGRPAARERDDASSER